MAIVEADNPHAMATGLLTIDVMMFACQSMWQLKDWILNDSDFGVEDKKALETELYSSRCLLVCAYLVNGSKHLSLDWANIGGGIADVAGMHIKSSKEIYRVLHVVVCADSSEEFHGIEIGKLLRRRRDRSDSIINRHWLS